MLAAEVIGTVVATRKHERLLGKKLLIVKRLDQDGRLTDDELIAIDTVGAGVGDRVLVLKEGGSASMTMGIEKPPANVVIVGIIDEVHLRDNDFTEDEWLKAAASNPVFDFLKDSEEDICSPDDGKPSTAKMSGRRDDADGAA